MPCDAVQPMTVYVFRVGCYAKIGRTNDIRRRLAEVSARTPGCLYPSDLDAGDATLEGFMYGDEEVERAIQDAFSDLHVMGEWFRYDERLGKWAQRRRQTLPPLPGQPIRF
jgi:hypothetical protein